MYPADQHDAGERAATCASGGAFEEVTAIGPFHNAHQAGALTPAPPTSTPTRPRCFDIVTGTTASTFIDLMRTVTDRAASIRPVVRQPILGVRQPPSDSDVLSPRSPPTASPSE